MSEYSEWQRIDETRIYSSGHYLVHQDEIIELFQSKQLENRQVAEEIKAGELVTSELKADPGIHFQFFPLRDGNKLVMEILAPAESLERIPELLPKGVKKIMKTHDPVQLHTQKIT